MAPGRRPKAAQQHPRPGSGGGTTQRNNRDFKGHNGTHRLMRARGAEMSVGARAGNARRGWLALLGAVATLLYLAAAAQAAPPLTIAGPGRGAGQVNLPLGAAVDQSSGDLYVADRNNFRIDKFDSEGNFLLAWGFGVADNQSAELQTCGPQATPPTLKCFHSESINTDPGAGNITAESVAVDQSSGDVYVADSFKNRVTKFSPDGSFIFMIGKNVNASGITQEEKNICTAEDVEEEDACGTGQSGAGAGEFFSGPASVAVGPSGDLWVGDNGRVLEFDAEGSLISEAPVPGGGGVVKSLGIDPVSGDFYLKSASLPGIRRYAPSGSPVNTLTLVDTLDAAGAPEALALDSAGNLYVGECNRTSFSCPSPYRFKVFNPVGEQTSQFGTGQVIGTPGVSGGGNPLAVGNPAGALYSVSSRSNELSAVQRFTLPEPGPLPDNPRAEDVLPTTATLAVTLNPEGHATEYHFEYGTTTVYGSETPSETLPGAEYDSEEVGAAIDHLLPETEYHFRLVASNHCNSAEPAEECTTHSEDATFTTPPAVKVDAQWTDDVAAASATFKAELDPLGVPAEWWLEYGTTEGYGSATAPQSLGAGFGAVAVARQITGLDPDTLYHYRFAARDERDGVEYLIHGPDQTVLTAIGLLGFELPDGRAWEQVTPLRKGGGRIVPPWLGVGPAAEDGSALSY